MHPTADRLSRVRQHLLGALHVDALVVTAPSDVRWASGFSGSVGTLLITGRQTVLVVDSRYGDQAREQCADCEIVVANSPEARDEALVRALRGVDAVGFDDKRTSYAEWRRLESTLGSTLVPLTDPLAALRARKDRFEIERIEAAARAADQSFADVAPLVLQGGATEREVRDELEWRMRVHSADGPAYPTIVASGPNAALPHHQPSDRRIRDGDSVIIDVGALVDGYRSDMTRTLFVGEVDPLLVAFHELLSRTQQEVLNAVREGVAASSLDAMARAGLAEYSGDILHSTGHGVGLDIHESPWLRSGSTDVLGEGHVVTVEPGLYRVGVGGVRIEDLVLVERSGSRILTNSTKDPSCPQSAPTT
jgi:Xaa-Pro aminopeptidase